MLKPHGRTPSNSSPRNWNSFPIPRCGRGRPTCATSAVGSWTTCWAAGERGYGWMSRPSSSHAIWLRRRSHPSRWRGCWPSARQKAVRRHTPRSWRKRGANRPWWVWGRQCWNFATAQRCWSTALAARLSSIPTNRPPVSFRSVARRLSGRLRPNAARRATPRSRVTIAGRKWWRTSGRSRKLRALLRASLGHDQPIMFPMIASIDELRAAKAELERAKREVTSAGHPVAPRLQVGMMVEVPAAAVLADQFARETDFFSIGTNDLTQYTMAADRTNERVAHLGDACHPAVLRQIGSVVQAAHRAGRWAGVCGELAGDPDAVPLLLGLDLDELSMAPAAIPAVKTIIRRWSGAGAKRLVAKALDLDSASAVRNLVRTTPPA